MQDVCICMCDVSCLCMSAGYECEQHNNPADFFVDVISGTLQRQHANSSGNSDSMKVSCGDSEPSSEFVININGDKVTSKIACGEYHSPADLH